MQRIPLLLAGGLSAAVTAHAAGLTEVRLTLLDAQAAGYATFQSHNQKVASSARGIFTTHLRSRNEAFTAQQWRLSRSVDGGAAFETVYESVDATNPPAIETDAAGNLYLVRSDFVDGSASLYRFPAGGGFDQPSVSRIPGGSAGKYSMNLDEARGRLYYFTWGRSLFVLGLDGAVLERQQLTVDGANAGPQYPLSFLDPSGVLHAAWTTLQHGVYMYWDIHYMASDDGARSWRRMDGTALQVPVPVDDTGPTDRITLDDEFEIHSWLSNLIVKDGKAHFVYAAQADSWRQHYVRYDLATAARDVDLYPTFEGEAIRLASLDGFFASRADLPEAPLYYVSSAGGRLGCLASDDNGGTWYDYAVSEESFNPYSIGGARELTADGAIVGTFTDYRTAEGRDLSQVHFFRIQAGLSRARLEIEREADGGRSLRFQEVRGNPATVRFRDPSGDWGDWRAFAEVMEPDPAGPPDHFQLRSHLGVDSRVFAVEGATAVGQGPASPVAFALAQNSPNPFNTWTTIGFSLPAPAACRLAILDLQGRRVRDLLAREELPPGRHRVAWDGTDDSGGELASGVYLYRLRAGGETRTRRLVLAK